MSAPALLIDGAVYLVGVRRVINRPNVVSVERLRYAGIGGNRFRFQPAADDFHHQPIVELAVDQIASIEEAS